MKKILSLLTCLLCTLTAMQAAELAAPVIIDVDGTTSSSFDLTWMHSADVAVTFTVNVAVEGSTVLEFTGITTKSYTVGGLNPGQTYTVKVKAVPATTGGAYSESAWSAELDVTTLATSSLPALPTPVVTSLTAAGNTSYTAQWSYNGAPATFTVMVLTSYGGVLEEKLGITGNSFTATGLDQGKTYGFQVKAVPTDGNAYSESAWTEVKQVTLPASAAIDVDIKNIEITCVEGTEGRSSFMITGEYLDENTDATITLDDPNGVFSLGRTVVSGWSIMAEAVVNVYFRPEVAGTYHATATVNYPGCAPVVVNINGTATMLKQTPVMSPASEVGATQFRATWDAVRNAQSYNLYVNAKAAGATQLLAEDFTDFTATTYTTNALAQMDNAGWTGKYVYGENGALRINDRAYYPGWIKSPMLDLSNSGGKATVTLSAKSFSTVDRNVKLTIKTYNGSAVIDSKEIDLTDEVQDFTVVVGCNAAAGQQVAIEGRNANQKRALLYNLTIYSGELTTVGGPAHASEQGDADNRVITGITDNTYLVTGLTQNGTYNFKVEAVYTDGTVSPMSNIEVVTLNGTDTLRGDVNADGTVDIDDVNALICIILGKAQASDYAGVADVDASGNIDVDDVNEVIKIILNK